MIDPAAVTISDIITISGVAAASGIAVGGAVIGWSHKILAGRHARLSGRVERSIDVMGRIEVSLAELRMTAEGISAKLTVQNGRLEDLEEWRLQQSQELIAFYRTPPWATDIDKLGVDLQLVLDKVNLMYHEWSSGRRPME